MLVLGRVKPALGIAVALGVALPAPASGVMTIGSNLAGDPGISFGCPPNTCTFAHQALPSASTAPGGVLAPSDGVVVRWRIKVGDLTGPAALRVTRPGNSDARAGVATGPTVTPASNSISAFDVRLPIEAGDALGVDCCSVSRLHAGVATPGASVLTWNPPLQDNDAARLGDPFNNLELLINADIEPDADTDGYGDETQDQCPTDASKHGDCTPPETTITKDAPNKTDKSSVKFKFSSSEPDSTFECGLASRKLKPCPSPKTIKNLDQGKHKFRVRAIDAAGNVDPSSAKDKFRVG